MARHHLDRDFATSQHVFQMPDRAEQLRAAQFDNTRGLVQVVSGYNRRVFVADPDFGQPEFGGDSASPVPLTRAVGEAE